MTLSDNMPTSTTKKKKGKAGKKLKRRADHSSREDVQVHSSLPPQVNGQLRCYLRLSINQIVWTVPNSPETTHVRVQWWGEDASGAIFRPADVKKGRRVSNSPRQSANTRTSARYAIRSGPKQLAAYLHDMSSLVLEVLSGPTMVTVGRAQVDEIGLLGPNRPINGFFPVFSADSDKIAELQVAIVLESIMVSYGSMSSIPTPDMSTEAFTTSMSETHTMHPSRVPPKPVPRPTYSVNDDPFISPAANRASCRSTPVGVDAQLFGRSNVLRDSHGSHATVTLTSSASTVTGTSYNSVSTTAASSSQPLLTTSAGYPVDSGPTVGESTGASTLHGVSTLESVMDADKHREMGQERDALIRGQGSRVANVMLTKKPILQPTHVAPEQAAVSRNIQDIGQRKFAPVTELVKPALNGGGVDIVSALIERGTHLRNAMAVSTVQDHVSKTPASLDPPDGIFSPLKSDLDDGSSGSLLKFIASETDPLTGSNWASGNGRTLMADAETSDVEQGTLDLVLGTDISRSQMQLLTALDESVSENNDIVSDLGDPLHDGALLDELLYKDALSDDDDLSLSDDCCPQPALKLREGSVSSLDEPGNIRPPSRRSSPAVRDSSSIANTKTPTKTRKKHRSSSREGRKKSPKRGRAALRSSSRESKNKPSTRGRHRHKQRSSSRESRKKSPETEMNISKLSEISRVSFQRPTSEVDDKRQPSAVDGLSIQRLTLLGRVRVARVVIDELILSDDVTKSSPARSSSRLGVNGKPPRPSAKIRNGTYFVEYQFPVTTLGDKYQPNNMANEVTRIASKKVALGHVMFGHRSVFPVMFDEEVIEKWWKSSVIFKVYVRTQSQSVPSIMGMCSVSLKHVLKSDSLAIDRIVEVKDRSQPASRNTSHSCDVVGQLKLSIELASDGKEFPTAVAKTRLAEMTNPKIIPIPQPKIVSNALLVTSGGQSNQHASTMSTQTEPKRTDMNEVPLVPQSETRLAPPLPATLSSTYGQSTVSEPLAPSYESLTLHTILMVPDGENISLQGIPLTVHSQSDSMPAPPPPQPLTGWSRRDKATRNLYLVCRMFWCDDVVNSNVCWGTCDPKFDFVQVTPVLLTTSLLERIRNNFMVIEVWDKKTCAENDQLVGVVKLSLHQFYMSYRDRRIANSLLKSQYPVLSVDTALPIVNPFSGTQYGQLKVLLAMGSMQQVSNLKKLKMENLIAPDMPERPEHFLERQHLYNGSNHVAPYALSDKMVEHLFEVCVEGVRALPFLDNMIWGEADCFVQYHFPNQQTSQQGAPQELPSLKAFRSATTLCIPDAVFHDVVRHRIVLSEETPVQREILTACAGAGGGSGGIPFEVWCRYYHPNVRDQLIAKTILPLAKLCALVTMQKRGEPNIQTFSLPLSCVAVESGRSEEETVRKLPNSGLLDVTVNYRSNVVKNNIDGANIAVQSSSSATTCISVGILRASGLKSAAESLAALDPSFQYPAEVGVNGYVRMGLSFLSKQDERITRSVARSFAPEFNYNLDFPCPLLWTEQDRDAMSLAEILETAEATFELWHQVPGANFGSGTETMQNGDITGRPLVSKSGDILLGTTSVPLMSLLKCHTGVKGWFALNPPPGGWHDDDLGNHGMKRVVGGLEVSLKFAHSDDLERVVDAARTVGWAPDFDIEHRDWENADESKDYYHQVELAVDTACFPLKNSLLIGQTKLDKAARCYVRYKFYDRGAMCSKLHHLEQEDEYVSVKVIHNKKLVIAASSPFLWYLREERLEVQVWMSYENHGDKQVRPRHRDKLIGSAYIDLSSLADSRRKNHRVSGAYPLFKPGASSLGGAYIMAHVALKPHLAGQVLDESEESDVSVSPRKVTTQSGKNVSRSTRRSSGQNEGSSLAEPFTVDIQASFSAHISIERALHLPDVTENGKTEAPSCYVSYQTADREGATCTDIMTNRSNPIWNYEHDCRLPREILTQSNASLVFKLWHKPPGGACSPDKGADKAIGFVSVDVAPLTRGLQRICGWYNIMDFSGQCQGQVKVAIIPLEPLISVNKQSVDKQQTSTIYHHHHQIPSWPPLEPTTTSHFDTHYKNVKRCHKQLQEKMEELGVDTEAASRSILFSNLRTNIRELDDITAKLKQRLQPPTSDIVQPTIQSNASISTAAQPPTVQANDSISAVVSPSVNSHSQPTSDSTAAPLITVNDSPSLTNEMMSSDVYGRTLSNARALIANINEQIPDTSPFTAGLDLTEVFDDEDVMDYADDTYAPYWGASDNDDAPLNSDPMNWGHAPYTDAGYDEEGEVGELIEPKPLNDISSGNFGDIFAGASHQYGIPEEEEEEEEEDTAAGFSMETNVIKADVNNEVTDERKQMAHRDNTESNDEAKMNDTDIGDLTDNGHKDSTEHSSAQLAEENKPINQSLQMSTLADVSSGSASELELSQEETSAKLPAKVQRSRSSRNRSKFHSSSQQQQQQRHDEQSSSSEDEKEEETSFMNGAENKDSLTKCNGTEKDTLSIEHGIVDDNDALPSESIIGDGNIKPTTEVQTDVQREPKESSLGRLSTMVGAGDAVPSTAMPNFFLPLPHLEMTMRALSLAKSQPQQNKEHLASSTVQKISAASHKTRPQPTLEQTRRVAKIFTQRFAS